MSNKEVLEVSGEGLAVGASGQFRHQEGIWTLARGTPEEAYAA